MGRSRSIIAAVILGLAGGAGGYWLYQATREPISVQAPPKPDASLVGSQRPAFTLASVSGEAMDVSQWDGQVVLLNFWATWCPPCRREIPALIELQDRLGPQGLQVVGIAIDQRQLVEEYRDTMGINYPVLVGETEAMEISAAYGNTYGQLPYSVVIDRQGRITDIHRGELTTEDVETLVKPLL